MKEVVIAGYLRTAQSRSRPKDPSRDWFCNLRADELLAKLLPEAIKRSEVEPEEIDDFLVGCAAGVNEQHTFGGRYPIFLSNFPESIPAKFIDQQCGSAMAGIHIGFMEIAQDFADIVLVSGMEHMTRVPMGPALAEKGHVAPNPRLWSDAAYQKWGMKTSRNMGLTAEKLFSQTDFTRDDLDRWGARSHQLAAKAQAEGFFKGEILPIEAVQADGSTLHIDYWEINEAFSIVALNCIKEPALDPDRVNVMGGGVAIGHPLGATGIRLTGTLARILNIKGGRFGCANACVGGGQGVAVIIEREAYDWYEGGLRCP